MKESNQNRATNLLRKYQKIVNQEFENDEKLEKVCSVIWGQCTGTMKKKMKSCEKYEYIKDAQDTIELLILTKEICYNFQDVKYLPSEIN